MELQVSLTNPSGKIDGTDEECENSGERVRDEKMTVGDDLYAVGVVHRVVSDKKNFGCYEDEEHSEAKSDPENGFESGAGCAGCAQGRSCHYSARRMTDVTRSCVGAKGFMLLRLS